ncbi:hypothetical protein TNCT_704061 [Trichonephila clavata]|uniref:DUF5641 domain-containing protein n=1 Tax=Trichonephila clavata TaxID=2740835 RepID=A0A8X6JHG7_TRICU|nr:hypothetical protein TNCT_704061 [Trichonephila clavata]
MKVGEIVLVENPNKKRLYWPLAKVLELLPGRDGNIRTLKLKCDVRMEGVPEPSSLSEVPVAYTDEEVNPELTEVTSAMDSCKFASVDVRSNRLKTGLIEFDGLL